MTNQQLADEALAAWQAHRDLDPIKRLSKLVSDFLAPPLMSEEEYECVLNRVCEALQ